MIQQAITLPEPQSKDGSETRWFSADSCVVYRGETIEVFVGGYLVGSFGPKDVFARNLLLVGLSGDRRFKKGKLARAFKMTDERLRQIRRSVEAGGLEALPAKACGGSEKKLKGAERARVLRLFEEGLRPVEVFRRLGGRLDVSYPTVLRMHRDWRGERESSGGAASDAAKEKSGTSGETAGDREQLEMRSSVEPRESSRDDFDDEEGIAAAPVASGRTVRNLGALLLVALVCSYGLHDAVLRGWEAGARWRDRVRVALESVIIALGIGQRCVEGVRRLECKSAPLLLRTNRVPSESWVRRIIKRYVDEEGASHVHLRMTGAYVARSRVEDGGAAVFYVDNHLRPYTGKQVLRKGWRMQDKRARPGVTDYYVHDEDGRPVMRVEAAGHDSLTDWLLPIGSTLRSALGGEQRVLVAFDRAGAFPAQMAELRDKGFEFVTYERRPFAKLPASAFEESLLLDGEEVGVCEKRLANLKKGRGRVRRIALKMPDGNQVNLLAVSRESKERLIGVITGRWVQENGFKHGNERWGANQLDRRRVRHYSPDTVIPNPARRRLDNTLKLARQREGELRRKLSRLEPDDQSRPELEEDLARSLSLQAELEKLRPRVPTHAPLEETELAGRLVYHDKHYKTLLDTVRIACANAESELAAELAPRLNKPAEAKKALENLFASPGDIRVNVKSITIALEPAGRKDEREAFEELFPVVNSWKLTLPGDPKQRPLRFRSQL